MEKIIKNIANILWSEPFLIIIILIGIYLTFRLGFIQIIKINKGFKRLFTKSTGKGEISSFASICMALSATIGIGNVVGVAIAISTGGPGALFWLILVSILNLSIKYVEGYLAVKYRKILDNGQISGGPFMYIEMGLGKRYRPLAKLFAISGCFAAALGIGTLTQVNGITTGIDRLFGDDNSIIAIGTLNIGYVEIFVSIFLTLAVGIIILGSTKRIAKACEIMVPIMAILYIGSTIIIIFTNIDMLFSACTEIFIGAFNPKAVIGAGCGITISMVLKQGISRGIFSNEAGLGSAAISSSMSKCDEPVNQGLYLMAGTIITILICFTTGLAIVMMGTWQLPLSGLEVTLKTFEEGLPTSPIIADLILTLCTIIFAYTSIIGWQVYGEKCLNYLTNYNKKWAKVYKIIYLLAITVGPFLTIDLIWNIADIGNALMAIPNLIAILLLSKVVVKETKAYFKKQN